eukprot:1149307-Pelagomonas_calceolata.AAC.2
MVTKACGKARVGLCRVLLVIGYRKKKASSQKANLDSICYDTSCCALKCRGPIAFRLKASCLPKPFCAPVFIPIDSICDGTFCCALKCRGPIAFGLQASCRRNPVILLDCPDSMWSPALVW